MTTSHAPQKVFRVRRNYNRWVANETLEDYALRFTAKKARRWSAARVSNTALGAISFLALEAIGGAITLSYGFENAIMATLVVGAIIFLTGIPICYHAAKQGTDIDLLTRGAGFGYIGSTITSLIYASFTFIFFALEAAILALALELTLSVPLSLGYVISALLIIPLVTHGITLISRFQVWTQPLWIILQIIPLVCIAVQYDEAFQLWTDYVPQNKHIITSSTESNFGHFNILAFGAASAVVFSLIAQIGEQVDFLRFLPQKEKAPKRWWFALLTAGPGWIVLGIVKILIGSFLAVVAFHQGFSISEASDPNRMYLTAFNYMTQIPEVNLVLLGVFVVISQLKINVTNAYAGSIAWSNFFSRLTHNHPGRVVWLVFNVFIALLLMELGIYRVLEKILGAYSIVALAWVGTIVADLVINRPLGLRPKEIEFKRAHLFDINPVGVGSMIIASILGFSCYVGFFGEVFQALASFIALGATFICAPLIAWITKGRYYIARPAYIFPDRSSIQCSICDHHFEAEDMTTCPAYGGHICSLCCSLDSRCQDVCKQNARFQDQLINALSVILPNSWVNLLNTKVGHFLGLFFLTGMIILGALSLVYFQISIEDHVIKQSLGDALVNVFVILLMIFGVISWMFTLAHDSRVVAQEESENQTKLLMEEIDAHKKTDFELQQARATADAANLAKSRYLTGISHELRSPLNAILGYAQLLEKDKQIPEHYQNPLSVIRRSSEHLADLIEGLLDISRIEAGRLELSRDNVNLPMLLNQIVNMFTLQANAKGLELNYQLLSSLPESVKTDEKRLRQLLINLLSNAVKYTQQGQITFSVKYRNQVAEFSIQDTGPGISEENFERIFQPFERIRNASEPHTPGTGLGLTITKFLIDVMGGDLKVESKVGEGSTFTLTMMLASSTPIILNQTNKIVTGYQGDRKTVLVVDDEPDHRSLLNDLLSPLGFNVYQAIDGIHCTEVLAFCQEAPSIFLLDVSMPGKSGWLLAKELRNKYPDACILMISANANVASPFNIKPNDGYLVKPFKLNDLMSALSQHAGIKWLYQQEPNAKEEANKQEGTLTHCDLPVLNSGRDRLCTHFREELLELAQIGFAKAIKARINEEVATTQEDSPIHAELIELKQLANHFQFKQMIDRLENYR